MVSPLPLAIKLPLDGVDGFVVLGVRTNISFIFTFDASRFISAEAEKFRLVADTIEGTPTEPTKYSFAVIDPLTLTEPVTFREPDISAEPVNGNPAPLIPEVPDEPDS